MIKIAICDDDQSVISSIEQLLLELGNKHRIEMTVKLYDKSMNLLKDVSKEKQYDLYYLDIEMPYLDGISLGEEIRIRDKHAKMIYVTSYENYAIETFKVQPFQFMKKPIEFGVFEQYLLQVLKFMEQEELYYHYAFNKAKYRIPMKEIQYFYSDRRTIIIVNHIGIETKFIGKLNEVESKLQASHKFLRIHQSYLVNYHYISRISAEQVELFSGEQLSISGERAVDVSRRYAEYVRSDACL